MIIERKLWDDMRHTLTGISMPLVSHQQVQQLLNHVESMSKEPQDPLAGHDINVSNGVDKET
jgi:hypothetical protein